MRSLSSRSLTLSLSEMLKLEQMKLMRLIGFSILRIAKVASSGIELEFLMMRIANSLRASTRAVNTRSSAAGSVSSMMLMRTVWNGVSDTNSVAVARFLPWRITVVVPSGISRMRTMRATVPIG